MDDVLHILGLAGCMDDDHRLRAGRINPDLNINRFAHAVSSRPYDHSAFSFGFEI
jgi:hypothetical protein